MIVAATGNAGSKGVDFPSNLETVLAVGAADDHGNPLEFSNWKGVSCNSAANIAALALTTGEPLPVSNTATLAAQSDSSQADIDGEEADNSPANPFEALRAAQADNADGSAAENSTSNARFTPRRIDPADVPPGMRVVSTPFGDRLVDQ